jgi:hypothetical protein
MPRSQVRRPDARPAQLPATRYWIVSGHAGMRVLTGACSSAILHCAVRSGGARQVARVAKGSGL